MRFVVSSTNGVSTNNDDLDRYMSSTMSCLWDRTQNCGDLRFFIIR